MQKPFVLPLQIFALLKTLSKFWLLAKNPKKNEGIWGTLAAPVAANSGKKTCDFMIVVVVAENDVEDVDDDNDDFLLLTIGGDGSRQYPSYAGVFNRVFS